MDYRRHHALLLVEACAWGQLEIVRKHLKCEDVNVNVTGYRQGRTPLIEA